MQFSLIVIMASVFVFIFGLITYIYYIRGVEDQKNGKKNAVLKSMLFVFFILLFGLLYGYFKPASYFV